MEEKAIYSFRYDLLFLDYSIFVPLLKLSHICSGSPTGSRLAHSETDICRGNEQCEKSRQSAMRSLLPDSRIDLTFHSATVRMSEGNAGANEALRVEFSTFLKLYVRLRANPCFRIELRGSPLITCTRVKL